MGQKEAEAVEVRERGCTGRERGRGREGKNEIEEESKKERERERREEVGGEKRERERREEKKERERKGEKCSNGARYRRRARDTACGLSEMKLQSNCLFFFFKDSLRIGKEERRLGYAMGELTAVTTTT